MFLFMVACLLKLVSPQDLEWNSYCVTDPLGRARIHLDNNSHRGAIYGLYCYDYYAEVYVPAHSVYTQRAYFYWEINEDNYDECIIYEYDYNYYIELFVYEPTNEGLAYLYNYTWCSVLPGVEERSQAYTDCTCDEEGDVPYHVVNNLDLPILLVFSCYDIYWGNEKYYSKYFYYDLILPPRSRAELFIIHYDFNSRKDQFCVLFDYYGYYEFYYDVYSLLGESYGEYMMYSMITCKQRPPMEEPIAEVIPYCPSSPLGDPEIELRSDIPAYAVVHCKNGPAHLTAVTQATAVIDASFDQGGVEDICQFYKQSGVHIYSVTVEVGWGLRDRELFLDSKIYTISCTYNDYGESRTSVERVGSPYIAPDAINVFRGNNIAHGVFELTILDVLDRKVHVRNLAHGSLIRLMATETSGTYPGFRAHTCSASNGITSYPILVNGCGDGQILDKNEGFYTFNGAVFSPYFQVFKLRGGANIWFDCIFASCVGSCEGTSCDFVGIDPAPMKDFDRFGEFGH